MAFSIIGVTKLLHRLGFTYKKPKIVPGKVDPQKQAEFLKKYEEIKLENEESELLDEMLFDCYGYNLP